MSAIRKPAECCNAACNQGRACPVRQACQLPIDPPTRGFGLRLLYLYAKRWYLEHARRQMGALHPDLPEVIHELRDIERELANLT